MRRRLGYGALVGLLCWPLSSCGRQPATAAECDHIFERLVVVELAERGFRDPVLVQRRTRTLRGELSAAVASCVGRPLGPRAMACIDDASNAEAIVHTCLK